MLAMVSHRLSSDFFAIPISPAHHAMSLKVGIIKVYVVKIVVIVIIIEIVVPKVVVFVVGAALRYVIGLIPVDTPFIL